MIPVLILFSMTLMPVYTTYFGEEVLLKTKPFDPRDLFRGDYVILNYEAAEIASEKLAKDVTQAFDDNTFHQYYGKDIYVVLRKGSKYHEVQYATFNKPKGELYIKGTISNFNTNYNQPSPEGEPSAEDRESIEYKEKMEYNQKYEELLAVIVDFKLDKYFVQENTGTDLEDASREGQLVAKVKVYKGYPVLIDIGKEED